MPIEVQDIEVGKCYVTNAGQVRKVTEITDDGRVNYMARGHKVIPEPWPPGSTKSNPPKKERFAAAVDREVRCDWDSDYPEHEPE